MVEGVHEGLPLRDVRLAVESEIAPLFGIAEGAEIVEDLRVGGNHEDLLVGVGENGGEQQLDGFHFDALRCEIALVLIVGVQNGEKRRQRRCGLNRLSNQRWMDAEKTQSVEEGES